MSQLPSRLGRERALQLLREMVRIRQFEARCAELYSAGKIRGFLHLYDGEEAVAVGVMQVLEPGDAVVATYREHGHAIARGIGMGPLMAELYGKRSGCSGGRGGSMHIFDAATRFYGGNAIVGGGLPLAVGLGLAEQMQQRKAVIACFFGEGAVAEGEFHESLNLATLWKLPVLFLCENNLYAMGTALARSESQRDLHLKAASYGLRSEVVAGMDVFTVENAVREAAAHARAGQGPVFLEIRTYRFRAHSMFDAQLYREKAEVDEWQQRGPIVTLRNWLEAAGLMSEQDFERIQREADAEVQQAVEFAEGSEWEPVEDLARHVYAEARGP
jgi:pyruvate dehydrogenase E1 component alpha subunit